MPPIFEAGYKWQPRGSAFAMQKKETTKITLRLPQWLLDRIRAKADVAGVPYQAVIKIWLAEKLG